MSGLVLTVHATCANVVGKVTSGRDVPPPPTILVGREFRPAATACQQVPDRSHNKIISECDVSFLARRSTAGATAPAARSPQSLDTSTMHIGFRCVASL